MASTPLTTSTLRAKKAKRAARSPRRADRSPRCKADAGERDSARGDVDAVGGENGQEVERSERQQSALPAEHRQPKAFAFGLCRRQVDGRRGLFDPDWRTARH